MARGSLWPFTRALITPSTSLNCSPAYAFLVTGSNTTSRLPEMRNRSCATSSPRISAIFHRTSRPKSDKGERQTRTQLARNPRACLDRSLLTGRAAEDRLVLLGKNSRDQSAAAVDAGLIE